MKKTPKKSPRKSPRKLPKTELKRTASQPAITSFIPKIKDRPSPTGLAPMAKKSKRILGDGESQRRKGRKRPVLKTLMKDDTAFKEAIVDPETLSSSVQGRGTLQEEDSGVAEAANAHLNMFPTPEDTPEEAVNADPNTFTRQHDLAIKVRIQCLST